MGHTKDEEGRLQKQAELYEDLTEDFLRRAGLKQGMRVLDVGCGVGDVSLLASRIVGPSGAVVGIDRVGPSLDTARNRVRYHGFANLVFEEADIGSYEASQRFDAVIGRLILLHLPDPVGALKRLAGCVRSGGVIAFQEMDLGAVSAVPALDLVTQMRDHVIGALRAVGAEPDMGSRLLSSFLAAGLPRPTMIAAGRVESGPDSVVYGFIAHTVQSLLPVIENAGLATAAEIEIGTLADRLRQDALAKEAVIFLPRLVGAWASLG
jgi:SAM-dependent methyltransferase